ncbi:MAG: hypothetical protein AB7H90_01035 [Alphaproteobacteria bacterium]
MTAREHELRDAETAGATPRLWALGMDGEGEAALHGRSTRVTISAEAEVSGHIYRRHIAEVRLWDEQAKDDARLIVNAVNAHDDLVAALRAVVALADEAFKEWDRDNDPRVGKILNALAGRVKGYRPDIDAIHAALAKAEGR